MTFAGFCKAGLVSMALLGASAFPSMADSTVNVSLADKGGMMDMSKNMGLGMGMMGKMNMAIMSIVTDQKTVPAGKVTFNVTNVSKETQHEMLVSPVKDENTVLPYVENENRVDEEASGDLGEVSELDPGKSGSLTLDLKPGLYILFCNIPGHYTAGMWTMLTVQ
jgi:uncharacterized cupredoxin-like copper-binding protein